MINLFSSYKVIVILTFSLLFFLCSCESELSFSEIISFEEGIKESRSYFTSLNKKEKLEILDFLGLDSHKDSAGKNAGEVHMIVSNALNNPISRFNDDEDVELYSLYLISDSVSFTNLVLRKYKSVYTDAYLYYYQGSKEDILELNSGTKSFSNFNGNVIILEVGHLTDNLSKNLGDCLTPIISINGGGVVISGTGGFNPFSGGTRGGGTTVGGGTTTDGGNTPGDGDPPQTEICYVTRVGEITGDIYIELVDCDTGLPIDDDGPIAVQDDNSSTSPSKSNKGCAEILKKLGVITLFNVNQNTSFSLERNVERHLVGTAFAYSSVIHSILDFDQLDDCGGESLECVREQLVSFINDAIVENYNNLNEGRPHTGPSLNLALANSALSDDQLKEITEATYIALINNNTHVFQGIQFALSNFSSNQYVSNNIRLAWVSASILHQSEPNRFSENSLAYVKALNLTEGSLSTEETTWLVERPSVLRRFSDLPTTSDESIRVLKKIISSSAQNAFNNSINFSNNMLGLYSSLYNKQYFFEESSDDQVTLFEEIPDIFDDLPEGMGDVLYNDFSRFDRQQALPFLLPFIAKAVVKGGVAALLDFGVQFALEYALGFHNSVSSAWNSFEVNWYSLAVSMIEANVKPKYAAYLSAAAAGLESLFNLIIDGEPLTLESFLTGPVLQTGLGFLGGHLGDYVGKVSSSFIKYGFTAPYNGLKTYFGDGLASLFRNYSVLRKDAIRAIWDEANVAPTQRGRYLEEMLAYTKFYDQSIFSWSNLNGETNAKVDFYSTSASTAISVKSAQSLTNVNAIRYFDQIYQGGIRDGILINGSITRFNNLQIDVVVPENVSGNEILSKVNDMYLKIQRRIDLNPSLYPELANQSIRDVLNINMGYYFD